MSDPSRVSYSNDNTDDRTTIASRFAVDAAALRLMHFAPLPVFLIAKSRRILWRNDVSERHRSLNRLQLAGGAFFRSESSIFDEKLAEIIEGFDDARPVATLNFVGVQLRLIHGYRADVEGSDAQPCIVCFVSEPTSLTFESSSELEPEALSAFELTNVETKLVLSISSGRSLREAAGDHGMKYNTARKYLQNIFLKVGVRRQSELIAKIKAAG